MGQGSSTAAPEQQAPVKRRGICRVCFEGGGDLIAPCRCKGTSRWIHRDCLNTWRASQRNQQVMTHCSECRFQYHLMLSRNDEGNPQLRALMRRLASQTIICFVIVQFIIVGLALVVRAFDSNERLVKLFDIPRERNDQDIHGYWQSLREHPETYYLAGGVAFLALFSLPVVVLMTRDLILSFNHRGISRFSNAECMLCEGAVIGLWICPKVPPPNLLAVGLVAIGGLVTLGLLCLLVSLVLAIQYAVREYARVQQAHLVASEYVVTDLADPEDFGDPPSDMSEDSDEKAKARDGILAGEHEVEEQAQIQRMITSELQEIFGQQHEAQPEQTPIVPAVGDGYGSVGDAVVAGAGAGLSEPQV